MILRTTHPSPLGTMHLAALPEKGISGVYFEKQCHWPNDYDSWKADDSAECFRSTRQWLDAYFSGDTSQPLPQLHLDRGTDFQRKVWHLLSAVPSGGTQSYGHLASQLDSAKAVRAVGAAVGRNPISLLLPCHRIVGSTGSLTGYAGGLDRKQWLLRHEGVLL
jgi:methylated-DNA-[protein]-cysteine S-methyltransferase